MTSPDLAPCARSCFGLRPTNLLFNSVGSVSWIVQNAYTRFNIEYFDGDEDDMAYIEARLIQLHVLLLSTVLHLSTVLGLSVLSCWVGTD